MNDREINERIIFRERKNSGVVAFFCIACVFVCESERGVRPCQWGATIKSPVTQHQTYNGAKSFAVLCSFFFIFNENHNKKIAESGESIEIHRATMQQPFQTS